MAPNNIIDHKAQLRQLQETITKNQNFINKFRDKLFSEKDENDPLTEDIKNREFL